MSVVRRKTPTKKPAAILVIIGEWRDLCFVYTTMPPSRGQLLGIHFEGETKRRIYEIGDTQFDDYVSDVGCYEDERDNAAFWIVKLKRVDNEKGWVRRERGVCFASLTNWSEEVVG